MKYGQIGQPAPAFASSGAPLELEPEPQRRIQPSERENPNEAVTPQSIPAWGGGEGGLQRGEEGKVEAGNGRLEGKEGGKRGQRTKEYVKWKASRGGKERKGRD